MDDVEQQEPIFELATECERLYTAQISKLSSDKDQNATELLSDLYKRFSTWAAFLGVFAEANVCLDRRLRRHVEIQDQVLRLLDLMQMNLSYVFEDGDSPKRGSIEPFKNVLRRRDLTLNIKCLDAITGVLERLNQVGTAIRRASAISQTSKARQLLANSDLTTFEQAAHICLQALYPDASDSLIELVTQSMVESYALFLHRKSRYERLQVPRQASRQQKRLTSIPEEPVDISDGQEAMDIDSDEAPRVVDGPTQCISRASVPPPGYRVPQSEPTSVDSKEFRARARSLMNPTAKAKPVSILVNQATYPGPADKDGTGPCNWCFSPLMTEWRVESSRWREHINEDFKPYICLSEKCSASMPRFSSSRQWLQHMDATHGASWYREIHAPSSWICPLCNESGSSPQDPDGLSAHFDNCHSGLFDEQQLRAIVRQSIYRVPRPRHTCPLCCFQIGQEPVPQSHRGGNITSKQQAKHRIPTPDGFQSKRAKKEMGHSQPENNRDPPVGDDLTSATGSNMRDGSIPNRALGNETIGGHVAAHLQTVMLLTLRLISLEDTRVSTRSQSDSSETDDEISSVSLGTRNVEDDLSDVDGSLPSQGGGDTDFDDGLHSMGSVPDSEPISWDNILGRPLGLDRDGHVENSEVDPVTQSSSYKYYPIQGIKDGLNPDNQPPLRREFNEWVDSKAQSDRDQVVLFVLALEYFQAIDASSKDSYFQIAGIYGMPYVSWDEPGVTVEEVRGKGYSVHGNCLFPLWIRPYLLLFEQRIHEIMVGEIIPKMQGNPTKKEELLKAANTWRLPYWDWARSPRIPKVCALENLNMKVLGKTIKKPNPLFKFRMPNGQKVSDYGVEMPGQLESFPEYLPYATWPATSHRPTDNQYIITSNAPGGGDSGITEQAKAHESWNGIESLEMVRRLLTSPMDFVSFATNVGNNLSIELIHKSIQWRESPLVSAFDPIFWLHLCNLDRIFAIWQTLNPNKWFKADATRPAAQETIGMGKIITNKTPLRPFHKDEDGTVWRPYDARNWLELGYTYPELRFQTPRINSKAVLLHNIANVYDATRTITPQAAKVAKRYEGDIEPNVDGMTLSNYAIAAKYSKFALCGHPFSLEIYLLPEDQTDRDFRPEHFLTSVFNLGQAATQDGETGWREEQGDQFTVYVPLTPFLCRRIQQQQREGQSAIVVDKLLRRIYWRMAMVDAENSEDIQQDRINDTAEFSVVTLSILFMKHGGE